MADDVVAELDRWLDNSNDSTTAIERRQVVRARDEIVALRARCAISDVDVLIEVGRNEALEDAARVVEDYFNPETCGPCAAAIRALKEQ